jgi:hypothetical protein
MSTLLVKKKEQKRFSFDNNAATMTKKKVDNQIRTLIENGIKTRTRSMFVIVGDKGRDQVCANVDFLLSDDRHLKHSLNLDVTTKWATSQKQIDRSFTN